MGQIVLNGVAYAGALGGACGGFVDTADVLQAQTSATSINYTATKDCAVFVSATMAYNTVARFLIDGVQLYAFTSNSNFTYQNTIFLRRGQTLTSNHSTTPDAGHYAVYGVMQGLDSVTLDRYSTGEKAVGVWIDGKTLYQKTFPATWSTNNESIQLDFTPDTIFFVMDGSYKKDGANNVGYLGYFVDSSNRTIAYYKASDNTIVCQAVGSNYTGSGYITIRYTKAST